MDSASSSTNGPDRLLEYTRKPASTIHAARHHVPLARSGSLADLTLGRGRGIRRIGAQGSRGRSKVRDSRTLNHEPGTSNPDPETAAFYFLGRWNDMMVMAPSIWLNQCGTPSGTMKKSPLVSFVGVPPSIDLPDRFAPLRVSPTSLPPVVIIADPSIT